MSNTDTIRFGYLTDTHLSATRTAFRTDSYLDSVLSKMAQCYRHFNDSHCAFVVHGGDFFDRPRAFSFQMLLRAREIVTGSGIPTCFIWGQHDLTGYNRETAAQSSLAFLKEICGDKLREIRSALEIGGVRLMACHADGDPRKFLPALKPAKDGRPQVAVVHALLYDKPSAFDTIDVHDIGECAEDAVLSGDLHCGFAPVRQGRTVYYNPGALARTAREERRPRAAVVELRPLLGQWEAAIEEFFPECEDYPFPAEEIPAPAGEIQQDSDAYIDAFNAFRAEARDIYERLEKTGRANGVDPAILAYINSKRKQE